MEAAGKFLAALQSEMRRGNIAPATEAHLRYEFRSIGWQNTERLTHAVTIEIERLEREADCLRTLRDRSP
jgi:hypothetical protein